ncbi:ABC transporter permease subunit [Listeria innocua]
MNHDVMDNDAEGIKVMSEGLLSCGVTSFLPTTLTSRKERLKDVAETIGKMYQEAPGAKIKGIYFEGPFFTEEHKGAQNPSYFGDPDLDTFHEWQEASGGLIKKIALAPERQGVEEFVKQVTEEGVVVSLGHSNATLEEAQKAVEAGASVFVHAFNGMRGLNHREPGMVGALLSLEHVFSELICDGHHVHPNAAGILMEKAGHEHVALITDCMMAGGMPDGNYNLGEFPVVVKEGTARLESGNLAGSILKLKGLVEIAFREVSPGVLEAADAMGASYWEIIWKVLIPESIPALISGLTVTTISMIGFTAMAGAIGAGGLGGLAWQEGYQRGNLTVTFVATLIILLIVFIVQGIGDFLTKKTDKR